MIDINTLDEMHTFRVTKARHRHGSRHLVRGDTFQSHYRMDQLFKGFELVKPEAVDTAEGEAPEPARRKRKSPQ